ncbi:MAG: AraC family transcriptional regulator [Caldilinea sp.]
MSAASKMNPSVVEQEPPEAARLQSSQHALSDCIKRAVRTDGTAEPLPGLSLHRSSAPGEPLHSVYDPVFCVIAQGSKEVFLGHERYLYDAAHYLIVTANLPIVAHVLEASQERPYLSLRLKLDPMLVSSVMIEASHTALLQRTSVRAVNVSPLDVDLIDAVVRLVRLIDDPAEARFMAPLITREIIYRLLNGEQCDRLH